MRGRSVFFLVRLRAPSNNAGSTQAPELRIIKDLAAARERIAEAKDLVRQAGVRPAPTLARMEPRESRWARLAKSNTRRNTLNPLRPSRSVESVFVSRSSQSVSRRLTFSNVPRNSRLGLRQPMPRYSLLIFVCRRKSFDFLRAFGTIRGLCARIKIGKDWKNCIHLVRPRSG